MRDSSLDAALTDETLAELPQGASRPRVFLSYSRKDLARAERLRDLLRERGFNAYLDVHDIMVGEPFRKRLAELIRAAEKVVFLISPDAVESVECTWEVDHAESLGKSVLPVILRDTDPVAIPGRLQRLHFTFLRDAAELERNLNQLVTSLSLDLAWEREKSRINDVALAWDEAGRPRRLLLFAEDAIRTAEAWRDRSPESAPPPTPVQLAFIAESRRQRTRHQRRTMTTAVAVSIIMGITAVFAIVQRYAAVANAKSAEQRSAILSVDKARELARSGETDAALLMMIDAAQNFSVSDAPDTVIAAFAEVLGRAARETGFAVAADTVAFDAGASILLHSPSSGTVHAFSPEAGLSDRGTMPGNVIAAAELGRPGGMLFVTGDGTRLRVWLLSRDSAEVALVGETEAGAPSDGWTANIAADGLVFLEHYSDDGAKSPMLFDLATRSWMQLDSGEAAFYDLAVDPAGRRFVAYRGDSHQIWSVGQDLSLAPVPDVDLAVHAVAACLGPQVFAPEAVETLAFLRRLEYPLSGSFEAMCRRAGDKILLTYNFSTSAGGDRRAYVYDASDPGQPLLEVVLPGGGTPSWATAPDSGQVSLAIHHWSNVSIYDISGDQRETVSFPSPVIFQKLYPDGSLLVLREPVTGTGSGEQRLLTLTGPERQHPVFVRVPDERDAATAKLADSSLKPLVCVGEEEKTFALPMLHLSLPRNELQTHEGALGTVDYRVGILDQVGSPAGEILFQPLFEGPCLGLSPGLRWMAVPDKEGLRIYDVSSARAVHITTIDRDDDWMDFDFLGHGPEIVLSAGGKVHLWSPDPDGGPWARTLLYTGPTPIREIETDARGRRILMVKELGAGEVEGVVYSIEAREELFSVGRAYKWLSVSFARDGSVLSTTGVMLSAIYSVPELETLSAAAEAELSPECRPAAGESWRSSPCWPALFRFTPTCSSWLNMVERFFAEITERQIKRGVHRSERALEQATLAHIDTRNQDV